MYQCYSYLRLPAYTSSLVIVSLSIDVLLFYSCTGCLQPSCVLSAHSYDKYSQHAAQATIPIPKNCRALVSCPYKKILITTVKILRVVITKGTICCLNSFIILYTKSCPIVDRNELMNRSLKRVGFQIPKEIVSNSLPVITEQTIDRINTHLFICSNISLGCGLYSALIMAWKSGKNPSTTSETTNRKTPINEEALSLFSASPPKLYSNIPAVIKLATIIFLAPSCKDLSLTPEQQTPTITTDTMLQDLTIITIGKLVIYIAIEQVKVERLTMQAHAIRFEAGIYVCFLYMKEFKIYPKSQANPQEDHKRVLGHPNISVASFSPQG